MIFKSRPSKARIETKTDGGENKTNITTSNLNGAEYLSKIISDSIMQGGRLLTGNSKDRGPVNNVAQDTYLMPFRLGQGRAFKDAGCLTYKKRNHLSDGICKAKYGTAIPYKRIHINEDGTFTDILTGKVYNTSATNGEDVVITGKANHWKEAGKRNINSYSPYSSIKQMAKDYLYKKLDNWVDKNVLEPNNYDINKIRRTLYNKLDPFGYNKKDSLGYVVISPDQKIKTALNPKTSNRNFLKNDVVVMRNPIYAKYLGLKDYYNGYSMVNTDDNLKISNYSPTIGNQGNIYYKSPTESDKSWGPFSDKVLARAFKTRDNKGKNTFVSPHYDDVMGHYTTSFGKDNKGKYISYYDIWDLNPFEGTPIENGDIGERYGIGKPVHLYNRKYYTDTDSTRIMNKYNRLRHLRLGGRTKLRNGDLTSKNRDSSKYPYPSISSKDFAGSSLVPLSKRDNFNINDMRY